MLRPQDLMILLKMVVAERHAHPWSQKELSLTTGLSQPEISLVLKRSADAGLYEHEGKNVKRLALAELLIHGVKYVFPARLGAPTRGIPTAWAAPPLVHEIIGGAAEERPVWPHSGGRVRGSAVQPLYKTAPDAALVDQQLYEALALVDAVRLGRARERELAERILRKRLKHDSSREQSKLD